MNDAIAIREVGPREGFQFEERVIPTEPKVELIDALSQTGLKDIQVTSFVSPRRVPQMADAEEVAARFRRFEGVRYDAVYLNPRGLERAIATARFDLTGILSVTSTDAFGIRNLNMSIVQQLESLHERIDMLSRHGIPVKTVRVNAAFGCNYTGDVSLDLVIQLLDRQMRIAADHGLDIMHITLADTMGWANPRQIKRTVGALYERWPNARLALHLHDTRGTALANASAAIELGVREFDASVGGLGGCPFAGHRGAAGNICTEDLVFLCEELGIRSAIDLDSMIVCAQLAQDIVGHELPGKLMKAGGIAAIRERARESARA